MSPPVATPRDALPPAVGSPVRGSAAADRPEADAPVPATSPGHIADRKSVV